MNIGIDIGGSHIAIGLVNDQNKIILKEEHNWTQEEKLNYMKSVEECTVKLVSSFIKKVNENIEKIGIGFPAANIINGVVTKYNKILDLPRILFEKFNIPTYLKNDVKCSAICEKKLGNLKEYDNCLFMTLGTGIGGAYFYKNELVTPNIYQGFEIGHMVIQKEGRACKCGKKGCFEEYASMRVFRRQIEELFNLESINSYKMLEILASGEKAKEVEEIINNYIESLSIGISNLISIFEPDSICIGGSFAYYSTIFMEKLKEKIKNNFKGRNIPEILIAKYENDAGIIGASMLESN